MTEARPSWFQRFLLPGFAFKAVVIGGGYATGRELAEFFLPSGPLGGLLGMALAAGVWSVVCVATFVFARWAGALDYRSFFRALLGRGWMVFEAAYVLFLIVVLAVFGAAAGAIGEALLGWPKVVGALALMTAIGAFAAFGNVAVERLFKWVSILLYGTYALFVVLALSRFGDRALANLATPAPMDGWVVGGLTYAGYNVVGAVVILPVVRHLTRTRDAVVAGLAAGPLAIAPAMLFFLCMAAFYPEVGGEALPSDFLLAKLNLPWFRALFQLMIFAALLESGTGIVHAVNERLSAAHRTRVGRDLSGLSRLAIAGALLVLSMLLADRFGLVTLIAKGYRALAWTILAIYVLPLMTFGLWRLVRRPALAPRPST